MDFEQIYQLSRDYLKANNQPYKRDVDVQRLFKHRLSVLLGQRGVGKTTIIAQYLLGLNHNPLNTEVLYVPVDHFLISTYALYDIAEQFYLKGGKVIAFDEIHKYPAWSQELKSIYDSFPKLHVVASGSSALEIHKGSHDLSRRAIISTISGLSFREYLELHLDQKFNAYSLDEILNGHLAICHNIANQLGDKKILALFGDYLKVGYYPYFLELNDHELYAKTLEQNLITTIESDLISIYPSLTGGTLRKLKQLLSFIATSVPFVLDMKKLKQLSDVSDTRTVKAYLKYLEDAGLIRLLLKASTSLTALETAEKIYLNNPNQLYAIAASQNNIGTVRELFFLCMLADGHKLSAPKSGDFLVDDCYLFEVGGRKKSIKQISGKEDAYLACDDIEYGIANKIPLWLFGFVR
jgi:uncharacterized protein